MSWWSAENTLAEGSEPDSTVASSIARQDIGAISEAQNQETGLLSPEEWRPSEHRRRAREAVDLAQEELIQTCEAGLRVVRRLMGYLLVVSVWVGAATGVCQWIIIESRRGSLQKDWWKCLCDDTAVAHWVNSDQEEKLPGVLATTMTQSTILAWVSLIITQRACIRADWISSAIVNVAFMALLMLLPPFSAAWPAPTAIASSLVNLIFWVRRPVFHRAPRPNKCARAYTFCALCIGLTGAVLLSNVAALVFLARAEKKRAATVAAEDAAYALHADEEETCGEEETKEERSEAGRSEAKSEGKSEARTPSQDEAGRPTVAHRPTVARRHERRRLEHRLYCCAATPRTLFSAGIMVFGYMISALARTYISVMSQRAFDDSLFSPRGSVPGSDNPVVRGAVVYVAAVPALNIGASAAFTSLASLLRGFAAEDLANFRIAFLLGAVALYVDLPAFVATVHGALRNGLFNLDEYHCVNEYMLKQADDVYGYPSRHVAARLCVALKCDLWGTVVHVLGVFLMTVSAARTFTYNKKPLATVVEPDPGDSPEPRRAHLLHTADDCTFEWDMRSPIHPGPRARPSDSVVRYSAIVVRPRHSDFVPRHRRQTFSAAATGRQTFSRDAANPLRQPSLEHAAECV